MERGYGFARVLATGAPSSAVQVDVYLTGTLTHATIYGDDLSTPTPKANPFTSDTYGYWFFYAAGGVYDVRISGGTPAVVPYTLGAITLSSPAVLSSTKSALPASGTPALAGRLARVTDNSRGLWMDTGVQWFALSGETFNVKEFGAVGNGTTDDTVAIQLALNTVPAGGCVVIPPGTYRFGQLTCTTSNIRVIGIGHPLLNSDHVLTQHYDALIKFTGNNLLIENLELQWSLTFPYDPPNDWHSYGFQFVGDHISIRQLEVSKVSGEGIMFGTPPSPTAHHHFAAYDCHSHHNGYSGIDTAALTTDILIAGGRYTDNGGNNGTDGYGITTHSKGVRIVNTYTENNVSRNIDSHYNAGAMIVTGNYSKVGASCSNVFNAIQLSTATQSLADPLGARVYAGIYLIGHAYSFLESAIVTSNIIRDMDCVVGILASGSNTTDLDISHNSLVNLKASEAAIETAGSGATNQALIPLAVRISNNQCINAGEDFAINVTDGSYIAISNNTAIYTSANRNTALPVYGHAINVVEDVARVAQVVWDNNTQVGDGGSTYYGALWSWRLGTIEYTFTPTASGNIGRVCTSPGTATGGAVTGAPTATTSAGSKVVTCSAITNIIPGHFILIATETFGAGTAYAEVLAVDITAKTLYLDKAAVSGVSTKAISWATPVFKTFGVIAA
jgi:hypothetical protein